MLFNSPSSIQQAGPKNYFEVEKYKLYIHDPHETSPVQLLGNRLIAENRYYPFLYLRSRTEGYQSLLLFTGREASQVIVWKVNHKSPLEFIGQFQMPSSDLKILLTLIDSPLNDTQQCILRSASTAPDWARDILTAHANRLFAFTGVSECLSAGLEYQPLLQALFNPYIFAVNTSINSLIDFVHHQLDSEQGKQVITLFDQFSTRLGNDFNTSFSHIARYCILRELVCIVTGKHVALDPFSWQHILSECTALCTSTFLDKYPSVKTRLIKYKSPRGHYFVERRGPGWIDATASIILPTGFVIDVKTGQQWGPRMSADEMQLVPQLFNSDPLPVEQNNKQYLISEVVSGDNLGHTLWNEVSGYVEFILTCQAAGWRADHIIPMLPPSIPSRFSKLGVRASFYPYVAKTLRSTHVNASDLDIINPYVDSICQGELTNQFFVEKQIASFRFPRVSEAVVRTINDDFNSNHQAKIRLYKNIRFHNKSQTNTPECLDKLFHELALQSDPSIEPAQVQLDLEFSDRHEETIDQISTICQQHGVDLNLCESYEVPELLELISAARICIAPIGSGAVLPTWVFHKPTVLHAEAAHRGQISWWHLAGNNDPTYQYLIPGEAIADDPATAGAAYGNYLIKPEAYAETIIAALKDHLASQPISASTNS